MRDGRREPGDGRSDCIDLPVEKEQVESGQLSQETSPLSALPRGKATGTEEDKKPNISDLQRTECEGDFQKEQPSEDSAADDILDGSSRESEAQRDPQSEEETQFSSTDKRAAQDASQLDGEGNLSENVTPLVDLAEGVIGDHLVHHGRQSPPHTSKITEAPGTSPRADSHLRSEDNDAVLNEERSLTGGSENLASVPEGQHRVSEEHSESHCPDNITNTGADTAEAEQGAVRVDTEHTETKTPGAASTNLLKELSACLGEMSISIEDPQSDYSSYLAGEDPAAHLEFGHIIEIYDFPAQLKTEDIHEAFASFHDTGFRIKWVDSTHALGIFSCVDSASQALSVSHSQLKTRPLSEATKQSKLKVARSSEFLQPVKERAQTNTVIAKRLVFRALGLQMNERKGQRDPRPKALGERKAQPHRKTEGSNDNTLDSAGDAAAE
ncbi:uncharacterized protein LOC144510173 [Mustelus asterias]